MPDTLDGRFDLTALHAFLLVHRFQAEPTPGPDLAQAVFDAMFSDMDHNLREIGVSDLTVGRRVRAMWEAFHGRAKAYAPALQAADRGARDRSGAQCLAWCGAAGRCRFAVPMRAGTGGSSGWPATCGSGIGEGAIPVGTGGITMIPELHRPIAIERVGPSGLDVMVEASAAECAALARRMDVPAWDSH